MAKTRTRSSRIFDADIRHRIYLQRYNAQVVRRMIALLNRTDADIVARLLRASPAVANSLQATLIQVQALNSALTQAMKTGLTAAVLELVKYEADFQTKLGNTVTSGVSWNGPTLEAVRAAALSRPFQGVHLKFAFLEEHLEELGARRAALVRDTIRLGFLQGDGVDELVKRLRGTKSLGYRDGLLETSRRTTETLVRTALNHTANAARGEVYELNAHLLRGVRWTAILDGRTSAVCRGRDGTIYPPTKGPRPPAHPNCRSTTVPVFKGDADPEMPSYGQWLKTQDREFIDDVLGKSKAKLFLDGNLSLDKFIDINGREYSLAELKRRDASAFKRAGLETV